MQTENEDQSISLMDLLLVVAENIKLLLIGPLLVGFVALAVAFAVPQSFTSQSILTSTPANAATIMVTPLVLDPVIKILNFGQGQPVDGVRVQLASQIKATLGKGALLTLDVTASSPADAQKLANLIIDQYLLTTTPGAMDRIDMEKRLAFAKVSLEATRSIYEQLSKGGAASLNKPITFAEAGTSFTGLGELQARYLNDVLSISRALQGLSRDVVIQSPTLPTIAAAPKKSLIAVLAALASGFFLLLWVFVRKAWETSAQDPQGAAKQARLRAALGFKTRQPLG